MANVRMDKLLEDIYKTKPDSIKGIGDIEVPDFESTMKRFEKQLDDEKRIVVLPAQSEKKSGFTKKVGVAVIIVAFSATLSFIFSTESAQAFKFSIVKTILQMKDNITTIIQSDQSGKSAQPDQVPSLEESNSDAIEIHLTLEEADKLPFHLLIPDYLPPGYKFKEMKWNQYITEKHMVKQLYIDDNMNAITITQTENLSNTDMKSYVNNDFGKVEVQSIDGQEVTFIITDQGFIQCSWYRNRTRLSLNGKYTKDEAIHIIKGMK